ncbi:nuclear transport factor 2 family protein [Streptomyces sp. TRM68416]|uniref:nuclear transport factor 2 family protein n=1 Tax=Streptomyces sp. TRM68416 TaxID=2758412 RepID=UPI0016620EC0|nr:nuclear transport factor 2 family protein [Streptomyces sp. TRM68416]MBD0842312.1 nuclear transport factor 2 family protein [Streptomyces sp. TRM68416]
MTQTTQTAQQETPAPAVTAEVYAEVQQFYAEHLHLLDGGTVDAWADTFTADAIFDVPTLPEPLRGREALAGSLRRTAAQLAADGVQRRHWHGMVAVFPQADGTLRVRCYSLVFSTPLGGDPALHRVCVCEDVLVREDGRLKVHRRKVTRDDLP